MTSAANTLSAVSAKGDFAFHKIERRTVGPNDIHIKINYSGICHSDIHTVKGEWGKKSYPLCPGHEIIGEVVSVGAAVKKFIVGDIAGVGCFVESCRTCPECKEGVEQYCSTENGVHFTYGTKQSEALYPGGGITQGGYSSAIVVDENYALSVPANLNVAGGAPLLCAGITCYSPFMHYGLKSGMTLGVVGLGGLGHMAVKIASAMGCKVVVMSRTEDKKQMALQMGATDFVVSTDKDQMKKHSRSMDMIYDSVAFAHDVKVNLDLLKSQGTMIMVGGIPDALNISSFDLIGRRLKIGGSCIGGIKETQEMLDFCSKHNIVSDIELIPATPEAVMTAYERAIKGDVKFRFVIDTAATMPKV